MKICNIVPIHYMHLVKSQPIMMFLTHLVLKYPEYVEFALNYKGLKILDNSLIECGDSLTIEDVIEAAKLIKADEIILPDYFCRGPETIRKVKDAIIVVKRTKWAEYDMKQPSLMAVVQGRDVKDFINCFNVLNSMKEIDTLGIPKVCATMADEGRPYFEKLWTDGMKCDKKIHLLGLWYSYEELYRYNDLKRIRSIDTCLASYFAQTSKGRFNPWTVRPDKHTINLEDTLKSLDVEKFKLYNKYHNKLLKAWGGDFNAN